MENEILSQPMGLGQLSNFANLDLSTTDTNYPVLKSGLYPFNIANAKTELSKDRTTELFVLELKTEAPAMDKNDREVPAGYKITHRIGLTPTFDPKTGEAKRTQENILRDVASLLDAVYGEAGRKAIKLHELDIASLINQRLMARTAIDPEKDGYPEQTRITRFIKKEGDLPPIPAGNSQQ